MLDSLKTQYLSPGDGRKKKKNRKMKRKADRKQKERPEEKKVVTVDT